MIRSCYGVMILSFMVDFLLLLGTNRLCGKTADIGRCILAAGIGGIYNGVCLLSGCEVLRGLPYRILFMMLVSGISFGFRSTALRCSCLYMLLKLSVSEVFSFPGNKALLIALVLTIVLIFILLLGWKSPGPGMFVPVELPVGGRRIKLTALRDTGNMLRDPISGGPVLVVGAETACQITGLTCEQLRNPVEAFSSVSIPGLRMIPYHTVGQPSGLLLAVRLRDVVIGDWKGSHIVAFSPISFEKSGNYQALAGGALC